MLNSGQNRRLFLSRVILKLGRWPWKTTGHLFYATSSFVHYLKAIGDFKLELQSGNAQFGSKSTIFVLCDLEIWGMTLKNNRAHLLCCFKLCVSFRSHRWFQTGDTVPKRPIWVKINDFLPCDLEIWWMTLKINRARSRAPLRSNIKLYVSFHHHMWIQTGGTVRKRPICVKINDFFSCVTLKFDGWPSKSIGHISLATSSFLYHSIICEFKLELWSGNG